MNPDRPQGSSNGPWHPPGDRQPYAYNNGSQRPYPPPASAGHENSSFPNDHHGGNFDRNWDASSPYHHPGQAYAPYPPPRAEYGGYDHPGYAPAHPNGLYRAPDTPESHHPSAGAPAHPGYDYYSSPSRPTPPPSGYHGGRTMSPGLQPVYEEAAGWPSSAPGRFSSPSALPYGPSASYESYDRSCDRPPPSSQVAYRSHSDADSAPHARPAPAPRHGPSPSPNLAPPPPGPQATQFRWSECRVGPPAPPNSNSGSVRGQGRGPGNSHASRAGASGNVPARETRSMPFYHREGEKKAPKRRPDSLDAIFTPSPSPSSCALSQSSSSSSSSRHTAKPKPARKSKASQKKGAQASRQGAPPSVPGSTKGARSLSDGDSPLSSPPPEEVELVDRGTKAKLEGDLPKALECYQQACRIKPDYATGHYNVGTIHSEMGQFGEAMAAFQQALSYNPGYAEAYCNLGVLYKHQGDTLQAILCYQRCLALTDGCEVANVNLAIALTDLGATHQTRHDTSQAITMYQQALYYNPRNATAHYNLAVIYSHQGQVHQAITAYRLALAFEPPAPRTLPDLHVHLGLLYRDMGRYEQAAGQFQCAHERQPTCPLIAAHLGLTYTLMGEAEKALRHLHAAIPSDLPEVHSHLGLLYASEGQIDKALASFHTGLQAAPSSRPLLHNRLLVSSYRALSPQQMYQEHLDWAKPWERAGPTPRDSYINGVHWDVPQERGEQPPLRVGYVAPHFFVPEMEAFVHGVVCAHSSAVQVYCYVNHIEVDVYTRPAWLAASITWRPMYQQSAEAIAQRIYEDQIDLLVDLAGHTLDNRLDVFLHRPAPLQLAYLGSPNTRGLERMDYFVCDHATVERATAQLFTEATLPLSRCAFAYTPWEALAPAPATGGEGGARPLTWGYCGELGSVNSEVIGVWSQLLRTLPQSRLLIRSVPFCTDWARGHIMAQFAAHRVPPTQVDLQPLPPMARGVGLHDMDIFLDPWPVGSLLSLCDALHLGIPVVSMQGPCYSHNRGKSILNALGMTDWVARDANHYLEIAVRWANQPEALQELRQTLSQRLANSPVRDCRGLALALEEAYRRIHEERTSALLDDDLSTDF